MFLKLEKMSARKLLSHCGLLQPYIFPWQDKIDLGEVIFSEKKT